MNAKCTKDNFNLLKSRVDAFVSRISDEKLRDSFVKCFYNTLDTTVEFWEDGTTYVFTGDIDAMWLRDSSAQVMQYLEFAEGDDEVQGLIKGLIKRQFAFIQIDPYANAFGKREHGNFEADECEKHPYVWERKFELDSLCYPLWLACKYYLKTGDGTVFGGEFSKVLDIILKVFSVEREHKEKSSYYHYRPTDAPSFSVPNRGRGGDVKVCGLIWSGYRPSDDACEYGYFIPGNMFVSSTLKLLASLKDAANLSDGQLGAMDETTVAIDAAIKEYAVVTHPEFGKMYAYEVDGLGGIKLMDDANVPSLLSIPYISYAAADDPIYRNTRAFALCSSNPYYYSGKSISGVGSPHTPENYVWPISLMMQGLTSSSADEINGLVDMLLASDAGTGLMHEGVYKDDPNTFTRSWFAWANSLFSLFILKQADKIKYISRG